jgi:outer membrane biosynthesis protein TonB
MNMYVVVVEPYDPGKGNMPTFFAVNKPAEKHVVDKPELATWFESQEKAEQTYRSFRNDFVGVDGIYRNYRIMTFREARALVLALGTVIEQSQKGSSNPPVIEVASTVAPEPHEQEIVPVPEVIPETTKPINQPVQQEQITKEEPKMENTNTPNTSTNAQEPKPATAEAPKPTPEAAPTVDPKVAALAGVPTPAQVTEAKDKKFYQKTWFKVTATTVVVAALAAGGWYGYQRYKAGLV